MFKEVYLTKMDQEFAMSSSPEVLQKYGVEANAVVLFKKVRMRRLCCHPVVTGGKCSGFKETSRNK